MHFSSNLAITSISERFRLSLPFCAASFLAEPLLELQAISRLSSAVATIPCIALHGLLRYSDLINFHQSLAQQITGTGYETDIAGALKHMNEQGVMRG